ncbi:LapA family protein [Sphingomonas baiyangensis]|uniref:DUF1049 domain-containing protein n=1 Tax=Sphingomonas baiyangensis TaxID=2572576 RepID=A0A4V5PW94_9SPHN|nr:DUF1049 domain-containing protein [Sphingomonas baiyangensis]TKD50778.1 DUF1049 domain-containing protein [Sphingomonas baiyangensis]
MQFLRTLMWVLLAVLAVAFSFNNWTVVAVRLWGGLVADINLPLLLAIAGAVGFVPLYLYHLAATWRLRNRIASLERATADMSAAPAAPPALAPGDTAVTVPVASAATSDPAVDPAPAEPARP